MAAERVALADLLDVGRDGIVERGDGGAHPLGLLRVSAEDVGVAEAGVLAGDATPQVPAVARLSLRAPRRGLGLRADGGALDATAVGDEHEVVLSEVDNRLLAVRAGHDAGGNLLHHRAVGVALEMRLLDALDGVLPGTGYGALGSSAAADGKADVLHLRVEVELHARLLKVGHHGQNHGLVLVVAREAQRGEVGQAGDVMDVALDVQLHLKGGMPVLKGEHGTPVQPEVGVQHLVVEEVGDGLVVEVLVRREEEPHDLHRRLVRQTELAVGVGVLAALLGGSAQREVGVFLVEPVVFVKHRDAGVLDRRDGTEKVPHDLEMVVHLAAAAHHVANAGNVGAVASTTGNGVLLEDVDVAAGHLRVADQIASRAQRRQAGSDDVGALVVDSLGLLGACKSFVVSAGVIHEFPHFRVAHQWFEGKAAVSRAFFVSPAGLFALAPSVPRHRKRHA